MTSFPGNAPDESRNASHDHVAPLFQSFRSPDECGLQFDRDRARTVADFLGRMPDFNKLNDPLYFENLKVPELHRFLSIFSNFEENFLLTDELRSRMGEARINIKTALRRKSML